MSIKEANKAIIRRFYRSMSEVSYLQQINKIDIRETGILKSMRNIFAEVYNSDCLIHDIKGDKSLEEVIREITSYFVAFPDTKTIIEDIISERDKVVTRWIMRSTHKDTLRDIPSIGKKTVIKGITLRRMVNGKVVEEWSLTDAPNFIQQIQAIPT